MDTIFACATAPAKSGVAVIRVSGKDAGHALCALTRKSLPKPRYATLAKLYNPKTSEMVDEALVVWFCAPASFTGEDVAELHIHGGRAVIAELLACLGAIPGLRIADPGEFSRRAFENGKMDLTQAEGLADLIDAETKMQARLANRQKNGELGTFYQNWRELILVTLANIEAYIDFPDEEIPGSVVQLVENNVAELISSISRHLQDNKRGEILRSGLSVAIIGPPNAGKSSLINLLARRDVAIVSEHAGTTRDIIEVHLDLGGYPIVIADTAGIRENAGEIEAEGIKRALARAEDADLRLVVVDRLQVPGISGPQEQTFTEFLATLTTSSSYNLNLTSDAFLKNTILVVNKVDLLPETYVIPQIPGVTTITASFKEGFGIDKILTAIKDFADENFSPSNEPLITRQRHRDLLSQALESLQGFALGKEIELAAEDLRYAASSIGKITGRINVEEILDKIFSSFCIGK